MRLMRSLRGHGLSVLAMLLLLLGTAAPAMARMTCVMDGHSVLNLGGPADCSPQDHPAGPVVSATCCVVLQATPQRTDFVPAPVTLLPVLFAVAIPAAVRPVPEAADFMLQDVVEARPPPMTRGRRLAAHGTFLI